MQEKESEKKGFTPLTQRKGAVHEHSQSNMGRCQREKRGPNTHTQCVVCVCQRRRGVEGTLLTHYQYERTSKTQTVSTMVRARKGKGKEGVYSANTLSVLV